MPSTLEAYLLFSLLLLVFSVHYAQRRLRSLPPGPLGLPLIGNLLDMTTHEQWRRVVEWSKKYGDIIHLNVVGTPFVFINSAEAVTELLHTRGAIYSDRPHLVMAGDLCNMGELVPLTRYGPRFKLERKLMNQVLSTSAINNWQPAVMQETHILLQQMLETPDEYVAHIRRMAGSLAFSVMYGYHVSQDHDPYVEAAEEFMQVSSYAMSAGWLVDFLPFLHHLPLTRWHKIAAKWRSKMDVWVDRPNTMFKELQDSPAKRMSFCGRLLLDEQGNFARHDIEHNVKWIASSVYGAGSDTTVVTLSQMILAMIHHPDVLAKAQAQLDKVVGSDRLPTFGDQDDLFYIQCILKETLRWGTPVPLTPPHVLMEADEYRGYKLEQGSFCVANMWAILHDENIYPEPHTFRPERFEEKIDPELAKLRDPVNYAFGFGRRRCPGVHFAMQSLWYAMAAFLTCFDIAPVIGEDGTPILPELKFEEGAFRHPKPFKCRITPRRAGVGAQIQASANTL